MNKMNEYIETDLKILVEGNSRFSGKRCLIRYILNEFTPVIAFPLDLQMKKIILGNISYNLKIWNVLIFDRMNRPNPLYYKGTLGVIFTLDPNNSNLILLEHNLDALRNRINNEGVPIVLVATKSDLFLTVGNDELEKIAKKHQCKLFFCSAKTGVGVKEAFSCLISEILLMKTNYWDDNEFQILKMQLNDELIKPKNYSCF